MYNSESWYEKQDATIRNAYPYVGPQVCEAAKKFAADLGLKVRYYNVYTDNWQLSDGEEYSTELITKTVNRLG
ncbi:hypothetical protein HWB91_gp14 [Bacillus phage vB_BboS-125]|uniref:Uncharacterized protein n=1 Tax=Bacillus phage vB_BboS-125 TaxID=2419618 RepID=A0A3G3BVW5_9CAUD|nr:hypothetical protein HWB91_gp14 [Bacillus phage vB_BboS-125]AYP68384.1 hypothetical protein BboS125_00014 [Bacillus phage vB_BboS-125]